MGSKKNPLAYTGRVSGSTKVQGDVQFNSTQFSVTDGIVSLAGGGLAVDELVGDAGSATPTAAGVITIAGGTNMSTTASTNTVTINMAAAISLATSVTAPTFVATAGNNMNIVSASGFNMQFRAGDDAGANFFIWEDSGGTDQMTLDSDGELILKTGNLVLEGNATQLQMQGGAATDFIGTATLSSGTVTVSNTNIAAGDRIFIQRQDVNSSTAIGHLTYTISAATSFTITSVQAASPGSTETNDASIVMYHIIREI